MADLGEAFWDERYRGRAALWSGNPNRYLISDAADLAPGRALDADCGDGADAIWLAERGWQVTAVDFSRVAPQRAADHARQRGRDIAACIEWVRADLTDWDPGPQRYDLVTAQYLHLPAAVRPPLFRRLAAAVAAGGTLLIAGHHVTDLQTSISRPQDPDRYFSGDEVAAALDNGQWDIVTNGASERTGTDPEGNLVPVHDIVIRARRHVWDPPWHPPTGPMSGTSGLARAPGPGTRWPGGREIPMNMVSQPELAALAALPTSPLLERVRAGIIGDGVLMDGPFGPRRVTYADYTASGRSLDFIEDFIRAQVLPRYANTHTESSGTGLQTTRLREDARQIIHEAVGGTDDDLVIFTGSGTTAAVNKLIGILELRIPAGLDQRYRLSARIPAAERPVVFVGPYEHHSNEHTGLWRHAAGPLHPQITLADLSYRPDGELTCPWRPGLADEEAFPGYLRQARGLLVGLPARLDDGPTGLSPDFETLRWFPLPPGWLSQETGDLGQPSTG